MVVAKKGSSKTSLTVTRKGVGGEKQDLTIKVGPREREFIVKNSQKISYDSCNELFVYTENNRRTTLQRKLYETLVKKPTSHVVKTAKNDYRVETFKV